MAPLNDSEGGHHCVAWRVLVVGQAGPSRLNSSDCTLVTKAAQEAVGTRSAGPFLFFESRMPTSPVSDATSMQLLPVPSLYDDLNQAPSGATSVEGRWER